MRRISIRTRTRKMNQAHIAAGTSNLGDMLKGLGSFIELVSGMEEKGKRKMEPSEIKLPGGKAVYGYSIKIGGLGPVIERFGNIVRETEKGPVVEDVREPFVDIFEEDDNIEVIAELPGVEEKDITYDIKDAILLLKTSGDREYKKEVLLPRKAAVSKTAYKNGVFKVTLKMEKEK